MYIPPTHTSPFSGLKIRKNYKRVPTSQITRLCVCVCWGGGEGWRNWTLTHCQMRTRRTLSLYHWEPERHYNCTESIASMPFCFAMHLLRSLFWNSKQISPVAISSNQGLDIYSLSGESRKDNTAQSVWHNSALLVLNGLELMPFWFSTDYIQARGTNSMN